MLLRNFKYMYLISQNMLLKRSILPESEESGAFLTEIKSVQPEAVFYPQKMQIKFIGTPNTEASEGSEFSLEL